MKLIFSLILIASIAFPHPSFSHSGRTDSSGGHNDRKRGGYHYHNKKTYSAKKMAPRSKTHSKKASLKKGIKTNYEFIKRNYEKKNQMELYSYKGTFSLSALKKICLARKKSFPSGKMFYYLVVFDNKKFAQFPKNPFTSMYGTEENRLKHIKAYCVYNKVNGFSEITYYEKNKWDSLAKTQKL